MVKQTSSSGVDFGAALSPNMRAGGGRFLLKRLVGRGDFTEVWLARDVKNARDVALKFLPRIFLQDENLLEQFRQDIRRNGLLKHPHIVPADELVVDDNTLAIAMEFVDGWSLAAMKVDKLGRCYDIGEVGQWVREVCDALNYSHSQFGLVHGDLKPSNLLSSAREGIKVTDFGFAALIRSESAKRGIVKSASGGIGFLSPQQVMGEPPTKLDDVYSLGATIFDLLTGTPPFYKGEIIAQICSLQPPTMTRRLAEVGVQCDPILPHWEETVGACLAKNPDDRPQSVEEVLLRLEQKELPPRVVTQDDEEDSEPSEESDGVPPVLVEQPVQALPVSASPPVGPTGSKWIALVFGGIVAVMIIAGLAAAALVWLVQHGKLVANNAVSVINGPGSLDKSFNSGSGADGTIRCMVLQVDGQILIGGSFTNFNGDAKIARLNTNGTLDATFSPDVPGNVYAIALEPDGEPIIGGHGLWRGHPGQRLVRLKPDGSRDRQFHGQAPYNGDVRAIVIQSDDSLLIGGSFTTVGRKAHNGLTRVNPGAGYDDSFNSGTDGSVTPVNIAVQPDGKILVAGVFKNFNGLEITHLIRLNPDGNIDPTFSDAAYTDENIRTALIQKDGKALICGYSSDTNNVPTSYIARLNPDGSVDASFNSPDVPGEALCSMAIQADGKIVAGGYSDMNRQIHPFLTRLNADGSPDKTFQTADATGSCVWSIAVQTDGKILAAGEFDSYQGIPCGNIVRLQN